MDIELYVPVIPAWTDPTIAQTKYNELAAFTWLTNLQNAKAAGQKLLIDNNVLADQVSYVWQAIQALDASVQALQEENATDLPEAFSAALWQAQGNLIEQQSAYLDDIKETFVQKRDEMGGTFDMQKFTESDTFKALVGVAVQKIIDLITDFIPGVVDDIIVDTIASYAPRAIGWGLVWLKKHFTAGAILCERMKEENIQLLTLAATLDHYRLRSQVLQQHDMTIQSLLAQVAQVESQLMSEMTKDTLAAEPTPDDAAETPTDAIEPVIQCPHTGDFIFAYSRGKMTKV